MWTPANSFTGVERGDHYNIGMTDADALMQAILAHPADDLPRLVYADWLDESGEPVAVARAEFIRVQCELTRLEDRPARSIPPEQMLSLRTRERTLQSKYGEAWLDPLRQRGEPLFSPRSHGLFRRGFVEVVWMPAGQFLWKAEKLFTRTPVRELRVTLTTLDELAELMHSPHLANLATLDLSDRKLGDRVSFEVVRSPFLRGLQHLRLKACALTDTGAGDLAGSRLASTLAKLEVPWNHFTELGKQELLRAFGDRLAIDG